MFQFIAPPLPHYITCGEDTYPIGGIHPDRSGIGVFDLIFVTRGCLFLEEELTMLTIPAGHYAILRPDRSHRTSQPCLEETHFYWLHFQTLGSWNEVSEQDSSLPAFEGHPLYQIEKFSIYISQKGAPLLPSQVEELLRRLMLQHQEQTVSARWKQQICFQDLLSMLQHTEGGEVQNPHLKVAELAGEYLRRHYREPISYKRMSEALHFHSNYIAICMKKTFGCTPLEYLTRHRIEQAKQTLIHTDDPIGRVAEQTGFGSFPYFVRSFARYTGHTPKSFRQLYRK